jgi:cysteine desulfurase family protein
MDRRTIYLDNAATSWPKPKGVLNEMRRFLNEEAGSPNRAGHRMSVAAGSIVQEARVKLARLFSVHNPNRIIHTFNCSDALNIAIKGVLREGDHVITTDLDHNSILRPLRALADDGVITLTRLPLASSGFADPDELCRAVTPTTKLIATLHASNVTGVIQPITEFGRIARERDCFLLIDAAQSAGVLPIDVEAACIDLLALPGHKSLLGPTGTGALYVGERVSLRPFREGGTGGDSLHPTQPAEYPTWLEAGTPNTLGLAGLNAALDGLEPGRMLAHERMLLCRFIEAVAGDKAIQIVGPGRPHEGVGVVSFLLSHMAPIDVGAILDQAFNIAVRPGLHCAPFAHRALGTLPEGTVRISPGPMTTTEDVDNLVRPLRDIVSADRSRRGELGKFRGV